MAFKWPYEANPKVISWRECVDMADHSIPKAAEKLIKFTELAILSGLKMTKPIYQRLPDDSTGMA